jgi:hypothetical protein
MTEQVFINRAINLARALYYEYTFGQDSLLSISLVYAHQGLIIFF